MLERQAWQKEAEERGIDTRTEGYGDLMKQHMNLPSWQRERARGKEEPADRAQFKLEIGSYVADLIGVDAMTEAMGIRELKNRDERAAAFREFALEFSGSERAREIRARDFYSVMESLEDSVVGWASLAQLSSLFPEGSNVEDYRNQVSGPVGRALDDAGEATDSAARRDAVNKALMKARGPLEVLVATSAYNQVYGLDNSSNQARIDRVYEDKDLIDGIAVGVDLKTVAQLPRSFADTLREFETLSPAQRKDWLDSHDRSDYIPNSATRRVVDKIRSNLDRDGNYIVKPRRSGLLFKKENVYDFPGYPTEMNLYA